MKHQFHVVYTPIEDGWFMATAPELPGAVTQGRTMAEARRNIREVVELLLEVYREYGIRAPDRSNQRLRMRQPCR